MREIAERLLSRSKRGWFKSKPLFEPWRTVTDTDIALAEQKVGAALPKDLRAWLLLVGYGDINEDFSFRFEWLKPVESGELRGAVMFAQDTLGNFYAWSTPEERIVFFSRSESKYAVLARDFRTFMEELERRDYDVLAWVETLAGHPYDWDA
jgi:SMI1 / KNR4 family (SUKH-1)